MYISVPASMQMPAAVSFVAMPPVERAVPPPPALSRIAGVISRTSAISSALFSRRGSAVYRPSISDRMISMSAFTLTATRAPRVSLSPTPISTVETVSFSLMTGSTLRSSSLSTVLEKFRCRCSSRRSSPVSRIWAMVWLYVPKSWS